MSRSSRLKKGRDHWNAHMKRLIEIDRFDRFLERQRERIQTNLELSDQRLRFVRTLQLAATVEADLEGGIERRA